MKNIIKVIIIIIVCFNLLACQNQSETTSAIDEKVPEEYGDSIIVARDEFFNIFKSFENLEITETVTMGRTDEAETLLIEFKYKSDNGDGVYGFIMVEDENGNAVIIEHGTEITSDKLIGN